ncbi:hypothetical protein A4W92_21560 [Pseudomonas aeruginosa]|nr:hypothetical protein A4W92_21560 [Pseudomonas aeruginosa]
MVGTELDLAVAGKRGDHHEDQVQRHRQQVVPADGLRGPGLRGQQPFAGAHRLVTALSGYGKIKLGADHDEPEFSYLSWAGMLFAAVVIGFPQRAGEWLLAAQTWASQTAGWAERAPQTGQRWVWRCPAKIQMLRQDFFLVADQQGEVDDVFQLADVAWPGNIRELENVVHFALLVSDKEEILPQHLNFGGATPDPSLAGLRRLGLAAN